jgi:hypothetical protein
MSFLTRTDPTRNALAISFRERRVTRRVSDEVNPPARTAMQIFLWFLLSNRVTPAFGENAVNAGEKMHRRAGVKLHHGWMPNGPTGGLLLRDKQDEKPIASPANVPETSSAS